MKRRWRSDKGNLPLSVVLILAFLRKTFISKRCFFCLVREASCFPCVICDESEIRGYDEEAPMRGERFEV